MSSLVFMNVPKGEAAPDVGTEDLPTGVAAKAEGEGKRLR